GTAQRGRAAPGAARPAPAALEPLVPPGRSPRQQGHGGHAGTGEQAAAAALARRRRARRAALVRPHLAVGARFRGRRAAYRSAAAAVALANEAARPRGGGAAPHGART